MGYTSIHDVVGINDEMKECVGNWTKYGEKIISLINSTDIENGENNKTETSEILLKDTKENIFINEDKNMSVRTYNYVKTSDGENNMDGQKSSNCKKRQDNRTKQKNRDIIPTILTYANVLKNKKI